MIGIPVYKDLPSHFTRCLLKLMQALPCPVDLKIHPGDSLVNRARNSITAEFLASKCTHLLQIDCDLIFSPEHIARIVAHPEPIVGGMYPKKQEGAIEWVCNAHMEDRPRTPAGLIDLRYIGTGFLRVAREVFERMIEAYPEIAYVPDHKRNSIEWDLWPVGVHHHNGQQPGRFLSEDWYFCQRALEQGFKVYGDSRIILKHVGEMVYPTKEQTKELTTPQNV